MKMFGLFLLTILLLLGILVVPVYSIVISSTSSTTTVQPTSTTTTYPLCSSICPYGYYYSSSSPVSWYCYATPTGGQGAPCVYSESTTTTVPTSSTTTITSTTIQPTTTIPSNGVGNINSIWAKNFFSNVSTSRGSPYYECPSLDQFANTRFNTMVANYQISHYGYIADFDNFSAKVPGASYAEAVFFPAGYTPSSYISYIIAVAPLHWQVLSDSLYNEYGYYIQNGPGFTVTGPNGGACSTTEIPGPGINITQYFEQFGCTVQVTTETWLVLELSSSCSNTQSTTSTSTTTIPTTSTSTSTTVQSTQTTTPTTTVPTTITSTSSPTTTSTTTISNSRLTTPTISPINPSAPYGTAITFTASVSGGIPPYTYYWYAGYSPNCASDTSIVYASTYTNLFCICTYISVLLRKGI